MATDNRVQVDTGGAGYFNAATLQRLAHKLSRWQVPLVPRMLEVAILVLFNCSLPAEVELGKGTYCEHRGIGVVINARARIGSDCRIGPHVVVGGAGFGRDGVPEIGNRVWLAAGARVIGGVKVGDGAVVGANAVVVRDVDAGTVVAGVPARVIRRLDDQAGSN